MVATGKVTTEEKRTYCPSVTGTYVDSAPERTICRNFTETDTGFVLTGFRVIVEHAALDATVMSAKNVAKPTEITRPLFMLQL